MKQITFYIILLLIVSSCKPPSADKSPKDERLQDTIKKEELAPAKKVVLSPPSNTTAMFSNEIIRIDYSAPGVRNRNIFGETIAYDKLWIAGAGRATWIETPFPLYFDQGTLPAGKYGVFMIPSPEDWIVIFNSHWDQNGKDEYDPKEDVLRLHLKPLITYALTERLVYNLVKHSETAGSIHFAWEKAIVDFDFSLVSP